MSEGAIVKKYQTQTLIPRAKEFYSGRGRAGKHRKQFSTLISRQQPAEPVRSGPVDCARDAEVSCECHCGRRDLLEVKHQTAEVCFTPFYLASQTRSTLTFLFLPNINRSAWATFS
jgi:hypothetical protein